MSKEACSEDIKEVTAVEEHAKEPDFEGMYKTAQQELEATKKQLEEVVLKYNRLFKLYANNLDYYLVFKD